MREVVSGMLIACGCFLKIYGYVGSLRRWIEREVESGFVTVVERIVERVLERNFCVDCDDYRWQNTEILSRRFNY